MNFNKPICRLVAFITVITFTFSNTSLVSGSASQLPVTVSKPDLTDARSYLNGNKGRAELRQLMGLPEDPALSGVLTSLSEKSELRNEVPEEDRAIKQFEIEVQAIENAINEREAIRHVYEKRRGVKVNEVIFERDLPRAIEILKVFPGARFYLNSKIQVRSGVRYLVQSLMVVERTLNKNSHYFSDRSIIVNLNFSVITKDIIKTVARFQRVGFLINMLVNLVFFYIGLNPFWLLITVLVGSRLAHFSYILIDTIRNIPNGPPFSIDLAKALQEIRRQELKEVYDSRRSELRLTVSAEEVPGTKQTIFKIDGTQLIFENPEHAIEYLNRKGISAFIVHSMDKEYEWVQFIDHDKRSQSVRVFYPASRSELRAFNEKGEWLVHSQVHRGIEEGLPDDLKFSTNLKQTIEKYRGDGQIVIPIQNMIRKTGLLVHIGLGQFYDEPVLYIDSQLTDSVRKSVMEHASYQIQKWEAKRKQLKKTPQEMRAWITEHSNQDGTGEAQNLAKQWIKEAPTIFLEQKQGKLWSDFQSGRAERLFIVIVANALSHFHEFARFMKETRDIEIEAIEDVQLEIRRVVPDVAAANSSQRILQLRLDFIETLNDIELALVIGHEYGHLQEGIQILKNEQKKQEARQREFERTTKIHGGWFAEIVASLVNTFELDRRLSIADSMIESARSMIREHGVDKIGAFFLRILGVDPRLADLNRMLGDTEEPVDGTKGMWLRRTHPKHEDRARVIAEYASANPLAREISFEPDALLGVTHFNHNIPPVGTLGREGSVINRAELRRSVKTTWRNILSSAVSTDEVLAVHHLVSEVELLRIAKGIDLDSSLRLRVARKMIGRTSADIRRVMSRFDDKAKEKGAFKDQIRETTGTLKDHVRKYWTWKRLKQLAPKESPDVVVKAWREKYRAPVIRVVLDAARSELRASAVAERPQQAVAIGKARAFFNAVASFIQTFVGKKNRLPQEINQSYQVQVNGKTHQWTDQAVINQIRRKLRDSGFKSEFKTRLRSEEFRTFLARLDSLKSVKEEEKIKLIVRILREDSKKYQELLTSLNNIVTLTPTAIRSTLIEFARKYNRAGKYGAPTRLLTLDGIAEILNEEELDPVPTSKSELRTQTSEKPSVPSGRTLRSEEDHTRLVAIAVKSVQNGSVKGNQLFGFLHDLLGREADSFNLTAIVNAALTQLPQSTITKPDAIESPAYNADALSLEDLKTLKLKVIKHLEAKIAELQRTRSPIGYPLLDDAEYWSNELKLNDFVKGVAVVELISEAEQTLERNVSELIEDSEVEYLNRLVAVLRASSGRSELRANTDAVNAVRVGDSLSLVADAALVPSVRERLPRLIGEANQQAVTTLEGEVSGIRDAVRDLLAVTEADLLKSDFGFYITNEAIMSVQEGAPLALILKQIVETVRKPMVVNTDTETGTAALVVDEVNRLLDAAESTAPRLIRASNVFRARDQLKAAGISQVKIIASEAEWDRRDQIQYLFNETLSGSINFVEKGNITSLLTAFGIADRMVQEFRSELRIAISA